MPEVPTEIEGPDGKTLLFRHYQLVAKIITSFDQRIGGDMRTARSSHGAKVQAAIQKYRGVAPIDQMMETVAEWTEGCETDDEGKVLERYGRFHTVVAIPGTFIGVAGEDGLVERTEPLGMPESGIITIPD